MELKPENKQWVSESSVKLMFDNNTISKSITCVI